MIRIIHPVSSNYRANFSFNWIVYVKDREPQSVPKYLHGDAQLNRVTNIGFIPLPNNTFFIYWLRIIVLYSIGIDSIGLIRRNDISIQLIALLGQHGKLQKITTVNGQRLRVSVNQMFIGYLKINIKKAVVFAYHTFKLHRIVFPVKAGRIQQGAQIIPMTILHFVLLILSPINKRAIHK